MDTEEDVKIQKIIDAGDPHEKSDGHYYHNSFWKAYSGGVRGELGGAVVGSAVGLILGIVSVAVLSITGLAAITVPAAMAVTAGFAAAGMWHGAERFNIVGTVTGASAANHERAEQRMKSYMAGKVDEIKQEMTELKSLVTGKPAAATAVQAKAKPAAKAQDDEIGYRKHCDSEHCPPGKPKFVFWKIAAVGLAVGLIAGVLLAASGFTGTLLHSLGANTAAHLAGAGEYAVSMLTMGLFGASFGLNRDVFRQVFDQTDKWFKGVFSRDKGPEKQVAQAKDKSEVKTLVHESHITYPASETHFQDALLTKALLEMDHTRSRPN